MARAGGSHSRRPGRPELRGRAAAAAVEQLRVPAALDWSEASFSSRSWKCSNTDLMPVDFTVRAHFAYLGDSCQAGPPIYLIL